MTDVSQHGARPDQLTQPSPSTRGGRPTITQGRGRTSGRVNRAHSTNGELRCCRGGRQTTATDQRTSGSGSWSSFMPIAHETSTTGSVALM